MTERKGLSRYFHETKAEMKKVTWPTKKETINHTIIVLIISVCVAAFIGLVDWIFTLGLDKLISLN
jgi:preprotein translocase subunit SecE